MSELQKFENSVTWRNKLRDFLLRENRAEISLTKGFNLTETNRYSFDISEDLKKLIEEKKQKKKLTEQTKNMSKKCENKENENGHQFTPKIKINLNDLKHEFVEIADETMLDCDEKGSKNHEISDESFEAMEMMCNKTASDHNSTLFKYLHSNRKQEVVANIKQRLSGYESQLVRADPESAAKDRLLNELRMEGQKEIADESPIKYVEMTQIEDIEAPSRFWDNDTMLQTSPVKMVGLLRPSTIFECAEISNVSSTQTSFKSAQKDPLGEVSSSCYETASDTMSFSKPSKLKAEPDLHTSANLIDLEKTIKITEIKEENISYEERDKELKIKNENLIDLTINTNFNDNSDESEESVIELLSDDDQFEDQRSVPLIKFEDVNLSSSYTTNDCTAQNFCEQDVLSTSSTNKEQSLHFNDTLEEVEYMMQKGLEFMAGAGITPNQSPFKPKTLPSPQFLTQKQHTFTISPAKSACFTPKSKVPTELGTSASKTHSAQKSASKFESRFALDIKPIPKLDLFKKPMSANKLTSKPASRHKDKFAHVISPIGTYIKKSAEAPLMSAVKTGNDDKNSSVFRELDFESRQFKPNFGDSKAKLPKSPVPRRLPKKAYISSEYRQVVDQRNAVTIPGGKSIQKYLVAAVLPSVIQHDGKANLACGTSAATKLPMKAHKFGEFDSQIPKRAEIKNDSFANLSLMTGDVSLYTIKDAQKL